ncbi:MAG: serine hydrolase [Candidatus Rokuibacteriota bacterium]|nr:MAG: serine hydrolase [Candidatus Rokubacteria bacterium]
MTNTRCGVEIMLPSMVTRDAKIDRVTRTLGWIAALGIMVLAAVAHAEAPDFSAVDEAARDAVTSGEVPGAVILVGRGDDVLYSRAFGWRALVPGPEPMTTDTIFDIASLTKPVGTAVAIMSLVEKGAVDLDAPLGRYLKEFQPHAFQQITIRRLLTHSAGLAAIPANHSMAVGFPAAARAIAKMKLDYPPGTGFQYSDTGFILLGEVVRRVSGRSLDDYLERLLFRPLGLRDTAFRPAAALRERIAPTEWNQGHILRGEVHDPRARELSGVAGHAGIFSTAADLARICRMLVNGGALDGRRVLRRDTIQLMWTRDQGGNGTRALGWDVTSSYALIMAPFFPAGSVGHTGFTGTSIWIDPASRTYLILLTNRVHPSGGGAARIRELRTRVTAAAGAALFRPVPVTTAASSGPAADVPEPVDGSDNGATTRSLATETVKSGLDVLVERGFAPLRGHAVGLVTNQTGIDARGRRAIDLIAGAPGVRLQAIFSPEHGIAGMVDADVPHGRDPATGRPIWSLYGPSRRPDSAMLRDVTALVFDIQDVGTRYYTYLSTLVYAMEEAGRRGIPVFVLDRPNPIGGRVVEGPLLDADLESFTGVHPIPVRTGLTIGEFGRLAAAERRIPVSLTVIAMSGWDRSLWYDQTGLPWVNPSPNIRSLTEALLYSGIGLLEATNLSVGRGTATPFEVVGAPWIEPVGLAEQLAPSTAPGCD